MKEVTQLIIQFKGKSAQEGLLDILKVPRERGMHESLLTTFLEMIHSDELSEF